jgi:phosphomannomutase/phosphoglucomutase
VSIFKACDIRGVYPNELDEAVAAAIGRAVGRRLDGGSCVVGGDLRPSTPGLMRAAIDGLREERAEVIDIGLVPTPVGFWAERTLGTDAVMVVTASHNPPEYNGVKLMTGALPVTPEEMEELGREVERQRQRNGRAGARARAGSRLTARDVKAAYLRWLGERFAHTGHGLKVVVDAGNGCACQWAPPALRHAGYDVVELFCEPDGTFPNRSPNPSHADAVTAAAQRVKETGAGFAVCFDGDADRAVFVDDNGEFVRGEEALVLLARRVLEDEPGAAVVYDQKSALVVPREIERAGGRPLRVRTASAYYKRRLIEEDAALAGEASGHFLFRELQGDDGIYAALQMGRLIAASGRSLSELRATVPPFFITEDIRIRCSDPEAVVERVKVAFAALPQDLADGVRIAFDGGWALCRPSVTEPAVTIRVEGDTAERRNGLRDAVLRAAGAAAR